MKEKSFVEGGYRHALSLILPLILSSSALTIMQFTDRILLARYSSEAIQAAMPAGCLSFTLISLFAATAGYAGTFVAQYHGAGDFRACIRSCVAGLFLAAIIFPLSLFLIPISGWIIHLARHDPAIQVLENQYIFWMFLGGAIETARWVFGGYLIGRNRVAANTVITCIACGLNIILDLALINGYWGFPRWGIRGAAIATFLSSVAALFLNFYAVFCEREFRHLFWNEKLYRVDYNLVKRIIRFGFPAGIQMFFDMASFTFFVMLTGTFDALSLATSNIAYSINNLAFSPLNGIGNASSTLVGQFQGSGRSLLAKSACWKCLHIGWIYMAIISAIFLLFPETLLSIFRSETDPYSVDEMIGLGRKLLLLMAIWGMFDTMNILFIGALKGAGDTRFVMLALIMGGWLFWIPSELVAIRVLGGKILTGWVIQCIYFCLLSLLFLWRWQKNKWMSIKVVES